MQAVLKIEFGSKEMARKAFNSLKQEMSFRKRSRAQMRVKGSYLLIEIEASEFPALRATVSSYLRLLSTIFSVLDIVKEV